MSEVPDNIKKLASSRDFDVSVRIGKSGITPALIEEVKSQLNKKNLVKLRLIRGFLKRRHERCMDVHKFRNKFNSSPSSVM